MRRDCPKTRLPSFPVVRSIGCISIPILAGSIFIGSIAAQAVDTKKIKPDALAAYLVQEGPVIFLATMTLLGVTLAIGYSIFIGFEQRIACPRCKECVSVSSGRNFRELYYCLRCRDFLRITEGFLIPVEADYVSERDGFAVRVTGKNPELWDWPSICAKCGTPATQRTAIERRLLVSQIGVTLGAVVTSRKAVLLIPNCKEHHGAGLWTESEPVSVIRVRSYAFFKELLRRNPQLGDAVAEAYRYR